MYPSVTQVLAPWADFSRINPQVLANAQERGTAVHRACAAYATGLWAPALKEEWAGYLQSFQCWLDSAVEKVVLVEAELVHPVYHYQGHPDFIVRIKGDSVNTVVDAKTPLAEFNKSWRVQLSAYCMLCAEYNVGRAVALRLRKDGSRPVINEYSGSMLADFSIFLACLQAWRFFKGDK